MKNYWIFFIFNIECEYYFFKDNLKLYHNLLRFRSSLSAFSLVNKIDWHFYRLSFWVRNCTWVKSSWLESNLMRFFFHALITEMPASRILPEINFETVDNLTKRLCLEAQIVVNSRHCDQITHFDWIKAGCDQPKLIWHGGAPTNLRQNFFVMKFF